MSCGIGCRHGWDPEMLWLWQRPAATAPTGPLAWEPPYALDVALEKKKKKKRRFIHTVWESVQDVLLRKQSKLQNNMNNKFIIIKIIMMTIFAEAWKKCLDMWTLNC